MHNHHETFYDRFHKLADRRSPFCLGIDPSDQVLEAWDLAKTPDGLNSFCHKILDSVGDQLAIVKPQMAYFERYGAEGLAILQKMVAAWHENSTLVLLDSKRGDIGASNVGYAMAAFDKTFGLGVDGLTLSPWLGLDALRPFFDQAKLTRSYVFVVIASSNPEGRLTQQAITTNNCTVSAELATSVRLVNKKFGNICGGVIGATLGQIGSDLSKMIGSEALILTPGIGIQGSDYKTISQYNNNKRNLIPTAARDVLLTGNDGFKRKLAWHINAAMDLR